MQEKVVIGSDHAGFELKEYVIDYLKDNGFIVNDLGTNSLDSTDYPDYAHEVAKQIGNGNIKRYTQRTRCIMRKRECIYKR